MIKKLSPDILRKHKGISYVGVTTTFFVYDKNGRFFMARRTKNARDEQGRWDIGAGGLKWGVRAEDNMLRELKEEYDVDSPQKITFIGYRDLHRKLDDGTPTHWLGLDYAVLVDPKDVKLNEPEIHDKGGWFTLETLPTPAHSQLHIYLKKHREKLKTQLGIK